MANIVETSGNTYSDELKQILDIKSEIEGLVEQCLDDIENIGYRDEYKGYLGDHMAGYLDSRLENGYLPYN